jgi:hypothetical protein
MMAACAVMPAHSGIQVNLSGNDNSKPGFPFSAE